ncbi:thioredoxin-dependent thiol peroxidase [Sphingobacteriaceae bacterium]|nr:thioredoxin-dependent thiol peroxidase [Sphingobacteriaceae bacterium]
MSVTKKKNNEAAFKAHTSSLKPGDKAPDFETKDQDGNTIRLADFSGKTLVLYFYPKDNTPTCTNQACNLRDEYKVLAQKNYAVVGVSADDEKSHAKFAKKFSLPFPLLADVDMKIIKAYDVWGTKKLFGKIYDGIVRTTFIIDYKGFIKEIIREVESKNHGQQILSL